MEYTFWNEQSASIGATASAISGLWLSSL